MEGNILNSRTKAFDRKAREGFAKVAKKGQIEIRHYRMDYTGCDFGPYWLHLLGN